jgi:hypothetical protein
MALGIFPIVRRMPQRSCLHLNIVHSVGVMFPGARTGCSAAQADCFCASANPRRRHPAAMRYAERLQQRIEKTGSRLCVGLDPRPGDGGASFARDFLKQVIDETAEWAAAFKPNMASDGHRGHPASGGAVSRDAG